ncbi:hypothetical protein GCM10011380_10190 [Sphingomonas metalli]|uniref:Uncharacterized protein n=1 Tax=Sphingomonas metalli TaxID=1779358 RepID=A0A916SXH3_9SPHN|nr:hypothetical protein [Sphingomonas metalli]GGB22549.1 hypothetical protein GCM10011380_10190 [Sphingomonas metalli]
MAMILVSNATNRPLTVWIEPWCDELALPVRSMLALEAPAEEDDVAELEIVEDRLVVWAMAPGMLFASIDGVRQDTGSRTIALPAEMLGLPVKSFVPLAFNGHPEARAVGASPRPSQTGLSFRLRRWTKAFAPTRIRFDRRR